ncbi:serine/threonine-protein kinase [Frankia sp. CiP3]|uniref:serine/threonine-protein kinase n=1 Tax=Frankia sp. CiP3 TaxID=2880971 RepID=UPI001EF5BB15|nr:serine/threonine-protein kinase [Frankia sp. CiP3]
MKLPALLDYQQAVQVPTIAFLDDTLRRSAPRLTPLGSPAVASGGFALTFDVTVDRRRYAVRCFHKQGNRLQERYAGVAAFVRSTQLDCLVDVDYLPRGIRVGEQVLPIVRMLWVEGGSRLNDWIDDHVGDPGALEQVRRSILAAATALRRHGAAHGDLQHGNILVKSDNSIKLVDYDGMYLPALHQYGAAEQGHRNYQHPERSNQYDPSLDLFASYVVDLSLAALAHDAQLWKEFNSGENLLFSATDFAEPGTSPVFARLERLPMLAERVQRLRRACGVDFNAVQAALTGTAVPSVSRRRAATAAVAAVPAIAATERAALLARQGDEVTVVGEIVATRTIQRRGTITFLNFGDYRRGDFAVVAFDRGSRDLVQAFGDPNLLQGSWISITGLITVFSKQSNPRTVTPQIELRRARALRVLSAGEAARLLAESAAPSQRTPTPAGGTNPLPVAGGMSSRAASGPVGNRLDDRLSQLYSSPAFGGRAANARPVGGPTPGHQAASAGPGRTTGGQPPSRPPSPGRHARPGWPGPGPWQSPAPPARPVHPTHPAPQRPTPPGTGWPAGAAPGNAAPPHSHKANAALTCGILALLLGLVTEASFVDVMIVCGFALAALRFGISSLSLRYGSQAGFAAAFELMLVSVRPQHGCHAAGVAKGQRRAAIGMALGMIAVPIAFLMAVVR